MTIDFEYSRTIKGFLNDAEAKRLHDVALVASKMGPCLEIGSYCGKSTFFIGSACKVNEGVLYAVDHHRGSEEQQPGEAYFDSDLYDPETDGVDTFRLFRRMVADTNLADTVIPIVAPSVTAGKMWATPLSMVFIDGGHTLEAAMIDYETWTPHLMQGGFLLIHDIFMDPNEGGEAPRKVYEKALASGLFDSQGMTETLGVLRLTPS